MKFSYDSIVFGILVGLCVPLLGFGIISLIFDTLAEMGIMDEGGEGLRSRRFRTLFLLGICSNLIPFNIFMRRHWDNALRGSVFPTIAYVGLWTYFYWDILFW